MSSTSASDIADELARGEYLAAADIGLAIIDGETTASPEVIWATALALARCGAADRAREIMDDAHLLSVAADVDERLRRDIWALDARLAKDRSIRGGTDAASWAAESARRYGAIVDEFDSHYAAVNAATMWRAAGDATASADMARRALSLATQPDDASEVGDTYWRAATRAEALLLLGRVDEAAAALDHAAGLGADWASRSTTRRQVRWVSDLLGTDRSIIDHLPVPAIAHYTGHMFARGPEDRLRSEIGALMEAENVGAIYGSLACGADLLVAEEALALGLEVHVVLPCPAADFLARSVTPAGADWVARWHAVVAQASSIEEEPTVSLDDAAMFGYCDQLALGAALGRARQTESPMLQIALWDGVASDGEAGTGAAVARWTALGGRTCVIDLPREELSAPPPSSSPDTTGSVAHRDVRAMLFADVRGFSGITEDRLPDFFGRVMGACAEELDRSDDVLYRNTWGDALYVVFASVAGAARTAVALQRAVERLRHDLQWPELALRIGGHAGPVFAGHDPVRDEPTFFGTHVTRAARIEPRTPPGEVYVTANFGALLALEPASDITLDYVGHVPTAKDYGSLRMFVIRDATQLSAGSAS